MSLNKSDIDATLAGKFGMPQDQMDKITDAFLEEVIVGVAIEGEVDLHRFGTFESRTRKARKGRNPRTGEAIQIAERHYVRFGMFKRFKDALNAS